MITAEQSAEEIPFIASTVFVRGWTNYFRYSNAKETFGQTGLPGLVETLARR